MSRVDEIGYKCEEVCKRDLSLAKTNAVMLSDIAKSLAVIADKLSGEQPKESQGEILEDFIGHLASEMKEKFGTGWCDCSVNEMIEFIREQAGWEKDL
jgi:hypothetical protein